MTMVAQVPGRRQLKVQQLKCYDEVCQMLRDGVSPWAVAQYVQKHGERTDIKLETLKNQMTFLKRRLLGKEPEVRSKSLIDKEVPQRDLDSYDDLDELTKLILTQKKRIEKDLKLEGNLPKLLKDLRPEIELLMEMIERRAKLAQDVGRLGKTPSKHLHLGVQAPLSELMQMLGQEEREKLRNVIQMGWVKSRTNAPRVQMEGSDGEDRGVPDSRQELPNGDRGPEVLVTVQGNADSDAPAEDF